MKLLVQNNYYYYFIISLSVTLQNHHKYTYDFIYSPILQTFPTYKPNDQMFGDFQQFILCMTAWKCCAQKRENEIWLQEMTTTEMSTVIFVSDLAVW